MTSPDDHFAASPNRSVTRTSHGGIGRAGCCPTISIGIVSTAGVEINETGSDEGSPSPNNHFTACPDHLGAGPASRCIGGACSDPTIRVGIISATGCIIAAAPNNHFAASPHCYVRISRAGRVCGAGCCPTVRPRIVYAARIQIVRQVVKGHLIRPTRSSHCRSRLPCAPRGHRVH